MRRKPQDDGSFTTIASVKPVMCKFAVFGISSISLIYLLVNKQIDSNMAPFPKSDDSFQKSADRKNERLLQFMLVDGKQKETKFSHRVAMS